MKKKNPITVSEALGRLQSDPEYMRMKAEREKALAQREAELSLVEAPLIADLASVGVNVHSVYDLVNTASPYGHAIPVLLDHLRRQYPDVIREGIARALAVRQAKKMAGRFL